MKAYRARKLWIHIKQFSIYLGLGFASALIAIGFSAPFSGWFGTVIKIIVFVSGLIMIEITVEKTSHGEEDP